MSGVRRVFGRLVPIAVALVGVCAYGHQPRAARARERRDVGRFRQGRIERLAGTAKAGYRGDGGPADLAELNGPAGLAIDAAGNILIADLRNHAVRRVDAGSHVITTVAGCGAPGFAGDGGPAVRARLSSPEGVSVDRRGNVIIADSGNQRVRRVDGATGAITTIAGTGETAFNGRSGRALAINLNHPSGVAIDERGEVYVADYGNDLIRAVAPSGELSTLVGSGGNGYDGDGGPASAATLNDVYGIALSPQGDLYLTDSLNFAIRRVARESGRIETVIGKGRPGPVLELARAADAFLGGQPHTKGTVGSRVAHGVDVDGFGNVFIAETGEHRLRMLHAASGLVFTVAGNGRSGLAVDGAPALEAPLDIHGVRADGHGDLYFVDYLHDVVNVVRFDRAPLDGRAGRRETAGGGWPAGRE